MTGSDSSTASTTPRCSAEPARAPSPAPWACDTIGSRPIMTPCATSSVPKIQRSPSATPASASGPRWPTIHMSTSPSDIQPICARTTGVASRAMTEASRATLWRREVMEARSAGRLRSRILARDPRGSRPPRRGPPPGGRGECAHGILPRLHRPPGRPPALPAGPARALALHARTARRRPVDRAGRGHHAHAPALRPAVGARARRPALPVVRPARRGRRAPGRRRRATRADGAGTPARHRTRTGSGAPSGGSRVTGCRCWAGSAARSWRW